MKPVSHWLAIAVLIALGPGSSPAAAQEARWWKGNLHTHSLWSDGDDFPEMVADWYKRNGYAFLSISDHNILPEGTRWLGIPPGSVRGDTIYARYLRRFGAEWVDDGRVGDTVVVRLKTLREYRPLFEEPGRFLLVPGEESSALLGQGPAEEGSTVAGQKALHVNVLNLAELVAPPRGTEVTAALRGVLAEVAAQRQRTGQPMIAVVNHPNYSWAVTAEELAAHPELRFFEMYNGQLRHRSEGDALRPSTERMWDIALALRLAAGRGPIYALATDDAHDHTRYAPELGNPGRGWVVVRAPELTAAALIAALERGDFYASSGVELREVRRDGDGLRVEIQPQPGVTYTTQFIGTRRGFDPRAEPVRDTAGVVVSQRYSEGIGEVLAEVTGPVATYRPRGDELYVRARVVSSRRKTNGYRPGEVETAWTQPWLAPAAPGAAPGR